MAKRIAQVLPEVKCLYDEMVSLRELKPHPKNRNNHPADQVTRLAEILKYQGIRRPIRVSKRSGFMTVGHGQRLAMIEAGYTHAPVNFQEYADEEQEYADIQADNAVALWAELDLSGINTDLADLGPDFDLNMLGIKDFTLDPGENEGECDDDEIPETGSVLVRTGDTFILGAHRLRCGDSANLEDIAALMNGEKADMVFTDPPYGMNAVHNMRVGYDAPIGFGKTRGENYPGMVKAGLYRPVHGDDKPFNAKPILELAERCFLFGANHFSDTLPVGRHWLVWDKKCEKGTDEGPFSDCELVWTNVPNRNSVKAYRFLWAGLLRSGERKEELTKRVHPTQKPVGLCAEIISDYSKPEEVVIDPYLGSGSTLIACEKTNRRCFGMEIDPIYCGVILDRWEKFSGKKAVREDGVSWQEIKANA